MTAARTVGIGGIGLLGSALAHRLIGAGFDPKGYDIDAAKTSAFAKAGGIAATLDEVARCDVVLLAVFDTDQVEDVVTNAILPAVTPGARKTVLVASTCDPDRIAALIARVAPQIAMIETPVSGSSGQVRNGEGVGLIGGERDVVDCGRRHSRRAVSEMVLHGRGRQWRTRQARDQPYPRPQPPCACRGPRLRRAART